MRRRIRGRLRRSDGGETPAPDGGETPAPAAPEYLAIDPRELSNVFAVPNWLRDIGLTSWLLVGVALLLVGLVWLPSLTQTIVAAGDHRGGRGRGRLAAGRLDEPPPDPAARRRDPHHARPDRGGGRAVPDGRRRDHRRDRSITGPARRRQDTLQGWLEDVGIDPSTAAEAKKNASASVSASFSQLKDGIAHGISALSGLAFFLALTILSLFFLLSDGPKIRHWAEGHFGRPAAVAHIISGRTLGALRGYFLGVTIVAGFNAAVVTLGALILGVPLVGTIAAVTFVGGYIPYLGAWTAAAFSVLLALGGAGPEAAGGMVIVQLLANGILQQLVQPFAMGAALGIHPLAVLDRHDRRRRPVRGGGPDPGRAARRRRSCGSQTTLRTRGTRKTKLRSQDPDTEEEITDDDPTPSDDTPSRSAGPSRSSS